MELAVPAGYELQWVGELLGGSPDADPELKYTKSTPGGIDRYLVVLTKSGMAQIEVLVPEGQTFDGTAYTSSVAWTAAQDAAEVRLSVRVPANAQIAKPVEGATLLPGDAGYSFSTKTVTDVKAGDKLELSAVYALASAAGAGAAAGAGQASGSGGVIPIVLILVALAAAAGMTVAVRGKLAAKAVEDADTIDADDDGALGDAEMTGDGEDEGVGADGGCDDARSHVGMSSSAKRNLVTGIIIVVLVIAAVAVGARSTRPQATGDTISQTFTAGKPCETARIPVASAGDPRDTAKRLFAALGTITGLKAATYNLKTQTIDVGYCESETSEGAVRQVLQSTGLVVPGASAVPSATP